MVSRHSRSVILIILNVPAFPANAAAEGSTLSTVLDGSPLLASRNVALLLKLSSGQAL